MYVSIRLAELSKRDVIWIHGAFHLVVCNVAETFSSFLLIRPPTQIFLVHLSILDQVESSELEAVV